MLDKINLLELKNLFSFLSIKVAYRRCYYLIYLNFKEVEVYIFDLPRGLYNKMEYRFRYDWYYIRRFKISY
jgi:hypothetical protein